MSAPRPPRIKRPKIDQYKHYCYECSEWVRDAAREVEYRSLYGVWPPCIKGICWQTGKSHPAYSQACVLFDGREK